MDEIKQFPLPPAGGIIELDPIPHSGPYGVQTQAGEWMLIICQSTRVMSPKLTSNALGHHAKEFWFKHSEASGRKIHTHKPGHQYFFAVQKMHLRLLNKRTYSNPELALPSDDSAS
jgi:hypothetical protein